MPPSTNPDLGLNPLASIERAIDALTRATLGASQAKITDANGWTKYDYGTHQTFRKRLTYSIAIGGSVIGALPVSSSNLPTGFGTLDLFFLNYDAHNTNGFGSDPHIAFDTSLSAAALAFAITNIATAARTYTGVIDVQLVTR